MKSALCALQRAPRIIRNLRPSQVPGRPRQCSPCQRRHSCRSCACLAHPSGSVSTEPATPKPFQTLHASQPAVWVILEAVRAPQHPTALVSVFHHLGQKRVPVDVIEPLVHLDWSGPRWPTRCTEQHEDMQCRIQSAQRRFLARASSPDSPSLSAGFNTSSLLMMSFASSSNAGPAGNLNLRCTIWRQVCHRVWRTSV